MDVSFSDEPPAAYYEFQNDYSYYFQEFRTHLDTVLYIVKSGPPITTDQRLLRIFADYTKQLYNWVTDLLDVKLDTSLYKYNTSIYPKLRQDFNLLDIPPITSRYTPANLKLLTAYPKWSQAYWSFLHYGSICSYIKDRQRGNRKSTILFSAVLGGLNLIIPCEECSDNYKKKVKSLNFDEQLSYHGDSIITIFNLHNRVNAEPRMSGQIYYFNLPKFEEMYHLKYHQ